MSLQNCPQYRSFHYKWIKVSPHCPIYILSFSAKPESKKKKIWVYFRAQWCCIYLSTSVAISAAQSPKNKADWSRAIWSQRLSYLKRMKNNVSKREYINDTFSFKTLVPNFNSLVYHGIPELSHRLDHEIGLHAGLMAPHSSTLGPHTPAAKACSGRRHVRDGELKEPLLERGQER